MRCSAYLPWACRELGGCTSRSLAREQKSNFFGGSMKLRFIVSSLALVTVFGLGTQAQELPKIDASVSYSYLRANPATSGVGGFNLNGGSASASYHFRDWLGGVADFGAYHVGRAHGVNLDNHVTTYLFGPRLTYRNFRPITPFAHVLFGTARIAFGTFAPSRSHTDF